MFTLSWLLTRACDIFSVRRWQSYSWWWCCFCSCQWVENLSLDCGHQRSYCSFPRSVQSHGGVLLTGENRRTRRETCLSATLSTADATWTGPGTNPSLPVRGRRLTVRAMARPTVVAEANVSSLRGRRRLSCHVSHLIFLDWTLYRSFLRSQRLTEWLPADVAVSPIIESTFSLCEQLLLFKTLFVPVVICLHDASLCWRATGLCDWDQSSMEKV
jgi:hypothetical protein